MTLIRAITACTLLIVSTFSQAEQKVDFGDYELHYIVLNTTEIPPAVAETYDIVRSGKRAFINLSILKKTDDGYGTPTAAQVSALQRTLLEQRSDIKLQEIREGDAIYYIGTLTILNREILWFDIDLSLNDGTLFDFSFDQQVWRE
jgi:hypothetical protein